ncbi:MAG: hypothetical protein DRI90_03075 [Deltaproteobacteria bacterium]|nr:MAG: hypothetical protein DRI90_03075 [Deltaproteobacteria bacterium]
MTRLPDTLETPAISPAIDKRIIEGFLADQEVTLQALERAGFDRAAILKRAKTLFRRRTLEQYRINPPRLSVRQCLGCGDELLSFGPQHRFCEDCRGDIQRNPAR